jgi:hypothetical protein
MTRKILTTITLSCCFAAISLAAVIADMNGKFSGDLIGPDGNDHPLTYNFKVDGDKLTGTVETQEGSVPIDSGKVSGNSMIFSISTDGATFPHKAKYYAQGDSVGLDVNFGGTKAHATLQRAK